MKLASVMFNPLFPFLNSIRQMLSRADVLNFFNSSVNRPRVVLTCRILFKFNDFEITSNNYSTPHTLSTCMHKRYSRRRTYRFELRKYDDFGGAVATRHIAQRSDERQHFRTKLAENRRMTIASAEPRASVVGRHHTRAIVVVVVGVRLGQRALPLPLGGGVGGCLRLHRGTLVFAEA
jgi:hypothetical protein